MPVRTCSLCYDSTSAELLQRPLNRFCPHIGSQTGRYVGVSMLASAVDKMQQKGSTWKRRRWLKWEECLWFFLAHSSADGLNPVRAALWNHIFTGCMSTSQPALIWRSARQLAPPQHSDQSLVTAPPLSINRRRCTFRQWNQGFVFYIVALMKVRLSTLRSIRAF